MSKKLQDVKICVVGLGYVGLPLACLLSKKFKVSGFDINEKKIEALKNGFDETGEVEDLKQFKINYSSNPELIKEANFIIVAVPTPIKDDKEPDLNPVESASSIVGKNLIKGATVVYESTVYPGCTEEICVPILEHESGLKCGQDFKVGYSPERVNPGDKVHTIDKIVKIVSGMDDETLELVAGVYGEITTVFKAKSIKVAEAAKVIENVQRSLNIALMNELSLIFDRVGISTRDVLDAAGTKWNFHKYTPGLVGGHCIGIDPYYLTHKAQQLGYEPKVILAGQDVNEYMVELVAKKFDGCKKVLIMGVTFKENVPDIRNSKAFDLEKKLRSMGIEVAKSDPVYSTKNIVGSYTSSDPSEVFANQPEVPDEYDGVIVFSPHDVFKSDEYSLKNLRLGCVDGAILFDIKGFYDRAEAEKLGFKYMTL